MLKSDLLDLIAGNEGASLEFKRDDVRPESMAKEIVAFANMNGGTILLGVEDNGQVSGIQRENLQAWLMDTVIGQYVDPQIIPGYEEMILDQGTVAIIKIPTGMAKPYGVSRNGRLDYYVRMGDTCQIAGRNQIARLFQSGGLVSVEKLPVHGSSLAELDSRRFQAYFLNILGEDQVLNWEQKLLHRELLVASEGQGGDYCCSFASYILFAKKPQRRLPQAGIRLLVFPGKDMDYNASLDQVLDIPFVGLEKNQENEWLEQSLPDRVLSFLQPHISTEGLEGMQRQRHWAYPVEAIRELLINAFAHRDWTRQNDVRLTVYSDRLEVYTPGALPNGITIDKIKAGQQTPRNTNIVRILRDYKFMDDRGMGIRRKVIPLMLKQTGREPEFEATEDYFKVTLWKNSFSTA